MLKKLNAKKLRLSSVSNDLDLANLRKAIDQKRSDIYIILDNVLDTYNIGSIFRLADAVGARQILLCGGTETPPNHRIKKASINTTEWVDWQYFPTTTEAILNLKSRIVNLQVIAIEQAEDSQQYQNFKYQLPIALVVGHETDGISPEVLKHCDAVVELPIHGVNISLNVMVSLAIVLYKVLEVTNPKS